MIIHASCMSDLAGNYKGAKTPDEQVIAILDIVNQSQHESKKEILKEVRATRQDLKDLEQITKVDLAETKFSLIKWMGGIVLIGVWAPVLVGVIVKYVGV